VLSDGVLTKTHGGPDSCIATVLKAKFSGKSMHNNIALFLHVLYMMESEPVNSWPAYLLHPVIPCDSQGMYSLVYIYEWLSETWYYLCSKVRASVRRAWTSPPSSFSVLQHHRQNLSKAVARATETSHKIAFLM